MYDNLHTALLPRGPQTAVLPPEYQHPSFPGGMPAIIAEPVALGYCTDCAWLARMIRAGRHTEQYAALALAHFDTVHARTDNYGITARHDGGHNLTGGAS